MRHNSKQVEHYNAGTVEEAIALLEKGAGETHIVAGGVDLVHLMKKEVLLPRLLVNIKRIPDMAFINEEKDGLRIGALTKIHDIEVSSLIKAKYPILAIAAHSIAAPQIRNMATIAGNLCQHVWCWYYRRSPVTGCSFLCRRKGGKKCYAIAGNNAQHAIIGGKECYASSPSDMDPALIALAAKVKIAGPNGYRIVPLEEFHTNMGNVLSSNEIMTEIQVPAPEAGTRQQFVKFRLRKAIDFAIASVAAVITIDSGLVSHARIVLGGVAPISYRAIRAEKRLNMNRITESVASEAAKEVLDEAAPLSMNAYKLPITEALIKRAILS